MQLENLVQVSFQLVANLLQFRLSIERQDHAIELGQSMNLFTSLSNHPKKKQQARSHVLTKDKILIQYQFKYKKKNSTLLILDHTFQQFQLPLPQHLNRMEIINALDQSKDVDCLQSMNVSSFEPFQEQPLSINNNSDNLQQYNNVNPQNFFFEHPIVPCAPAACIYILDYYQIKLSGIQTTIVGRGPLVGYPLSLMLLKQQAKVTICHQKTQNIMDHIKRSDLIIAAAGVRHLIQADWINPGSIVIDVGINAGLKGIDPHQYIGDVQFQEAQKRAHLITPVPGGVGPVTVSMLLRNIVSMWQKNHLSFMHQKKEQRIKDLDDFEVKGVYKSKISMSF